MLHQMMLNADGRRRGGSIVGYAAQRESYMSSEQQVVEYRSSQSPRVSSPKRIANYNFKEPEALSHGSPFLVPWSSPRAAGNKDRRPVGEFSPRKSSSPSYGKPSERFHGKQDYYGNYNHDSEYYEEEEGEEEDDYEEYDGHVKGKNRVSFRDDRMKAEKGKSYYDQGSYHTHDDGKYYKGKEYSSPRSNYGPSPFVNKPKKETYYEPSHGSPIGNNGGLAPIKTRPNNPNRDRVVDYYPNDGQQPKYSSPKSKDQREYQETIDSAEARRRYAKSSPPPRGGHVAEESYAHTIDSREAARRYNGVFVP